eukprot:909469-Lingulodinium_polyedra.AAC.1
MRHAPRAMRRVPRIMCHTSCASCPASCTLCPVSHSKSQITRGMHRASCIRRHAPGMTHDT